jgi:hypothetical protein
VDELPADASNASPTISMDAMSDAADTAKLLNVEMDEFSRMFSLIAHDELFGLQALEPRQPFSG